MARRAKFGQAPRVQPSLTSTLISIAREMVARQDANIMDAWRNGGEFEGRKVTDQMVLNYWQKRDDGLDKDDPAYDTIRNQIEQVRYAIQQSEMDLKHLQGKISHREFANFYLKWAKKAPRNSEWWRSLQKDAAQLMEQAKNESRQSADSAKAEAFNSFQTNTYDRDIAIGNELSAAMQKMSQETGLTLTDHGEELLDMVTQDFAAHPDEYHALTTALKKGDPNFSGAFTQQYFTNAMNSATKGYDKIADRANKDGYASAFASATKSQANMAWFATNTKAWPVATAYEKAWDVAMKTVTDPAASEMDKAAAWAQFATIADTLSKTAGIDTDVRVALEADAKRARGEEVDDVATFGPAVNVPGVSPEVAQGIAQINERTAAIKANPEMWEYAPVDANGNFDPTGMGPIGIVDQNQIPNDAVMVPVPGLDGTAKMVSIQPKTVYMEDPNNPSTGNSQNGLAVGRSVSYQVGGETVTLYETGGADGKARWSATSPFNSALKTTTDENGNLHLVTDAPALSQAQRATAAYEQAKALDSTHGTSIAESIVIRDGAGNITGLVSGAASSFGKTGSAEDGAAGGVTVKYDSTGFHVSTANQQYTDGRQVSGGTLTEDIPFAGSSTDPNWLYNTAHDQSRFTAGDIPGTTFNTAMGAGTIAFGRTMTAAQLKVLVDDPEFQHAFITQENAALGITNPLMDTRGYDAYSQFKTKVGLLNDYTFVGGVGPGGILFGGGLMPRDAATRTDLAYPGGTAIKGGPDAVPGITFAGQDIRVPAIPKIGGQLIGDGPGSGAGPGLMAGAWRNQVLQPNQQIGTPLVTTTPSTTTTTAPKTTTTSPTPVATTPTSTTPTSTTPGGVNYAGTTKLKNLEMI